MLRGVNGSGGGAPVGGSGTLNYVAKWTATGSTLGNSIIYDNGTNVGVGTASPGYKLDVAGSINSQNTLYVGSGSQGWLTWAGSAANTFNVIGASGKALSLGSNGVYDRLFMDTSGNVGFGTTSPTAGRSFTTAVDIDVYGVRVGRGAGAVSTNTVVGSGALNANTTGLQNTAVGANSLAANATGQNNTGVGYGALPSATGSSNTAIGAGAATNQTSGTNNTAVGHQAGWANTINSNNVSVGQNGALYQTGANNTAIGAQAMLGTSGSSTGGQNTAVGSTALYALTTGSNNTAVGLDAGNNITTGSANICLGRASATAAPTDSNQLVIGSAGQFVATNGGATTYYATAGASLGYIQVRLNGANVKIQVFAP